MAELVVLNGVATGTVFVLGDVPAVVGRSPEAHLQIGDPWISSMHAMFERREEALWVVDLESRNGVFLGEERVGEAQVPDGAVVRLGRTEIRFTAGRARQDEIPPPPEGAPRPRAPRDTLRADATAEARRLTPRNSSSERIPLMEGYATVLRMAVDAAGLEPRPGAALLLREALDAAAGAASEAGAMVARLAGIGVLAVFGLDGPGEDDASRALSAARAARAAVREVGGLELRAGVDVGPVVAGGAGASGAELTAHGPAAERAERLVALARPGEILAGAAAAAAAGRALRPVGVVRLGELELEVFRDESDA